MYENMFIMVRMICFSYRYSEESGYVLGLDDHQIGVSPQAAMGFLFIGSKE